MKFLYLFYFGRYSNLIFNLINYVLMRSQWDKPFQATPKYLTTIKDCLKPFQPVLKSETLTVREVMGAY